MAKKCSTPKCRKQIRPNRAKCDSCYYEQSKVTDPIKRAFRTLKNNAKRRNKIFTITLEDFKKFCIKTNYIARKGIKKESYHIDRKDETKGYEKGNLQVLTNEKNVQKYMAFSYNERGKPDNFRIMKNKRLNKKNIHFKMKDEELMKCVKCNSESFVIDFERTKLLSPRELVFNNSTQLEMAYYMKCSECNQPVIGQVEKPQPSTTITFFCKPDEKNNQKSG